jgi:hypothetical protein
VPVLPPLKFRTSDATVEDSSRLTEWPEQCLSISRKKPTFFAEERQEYPIAIDIEFHS